MAFRYTTNQTQYAVQNATFAAPYLFRQANTVIIRTIHGRNVRASPNNSRNSDALGAFGVFAQWVAIPQGGNTIKFQNKKTGRFLRIKKGGAVDCDGGGGGKTVFYYQVIQHPNIVYLKSVKLNYYLLIQAGGAVTSSYSAQQCCQLTIFRQGVGMRQPQMIVQQPTVLRPQIRPQVIQPQVIQPRIQPQYSAGVIQPRTNVYQPQPQYGLQPQQVIQPRVQSVPQSVASAPSAPPLTAPPQTTSDEILKLQAQIAALKLQAASSQHAMHADLQKMQVKNVEQQNLSQKAYAAPPMAYEVQREGIASPHGNTEGGAPPGGTAGGEDDVSQFLSYFKLSAYEQALKKEGLDNLDDIKDIDDDELIECAENAGLPTLKKKKFVKACHAYKNGLYPPSGIESVVLSPSSSSNLLQKQPMIQPIQPMQAVPQNNAESTEMKIDPKEAEQIQQWLQRINMMQYYNTLIDNGFQTIDDCSAMTKEDLSEMGVSETHIGIMIAINPKFINKKRQQMVDTVVKSEPVPGGNEEEKVKEWLKAINMSRYFDNFIDEGFDSLEMCNNLEKEDLLDMGVATEHIDIMIQMNPDFVMRYKNQRQPVQAVQAVQAIPVQIQNNNAPEQIDEKQNIPQISNVNEEMNELQVWLGSLNLSQYYDKFVEQGIEEVQDVLDLTQGDLQEMSVQPSEIEIIMIAQKQIQNNNAPKQNIPIQPPQPSADILAWLTSISMQSYAARFTEFGFVDIEKCTKITDKDLEQIGVSSNETTAIMESIPQLKVRQWLTSLNLVNHYDTLISQGFESMDDMIDIAQDDLKEMNFNDQDTAQILNAISKIGN